MNMKWIVIFLLATGIFGFTTIEAEARTSSKVDTRVDHIEMIEVRAVDIPVPDKLIRELEEAVSPEIAKRQEITEEEKKHEKVYEEGHRRTGERALRKLWETG
jgi:regulator of protease activity HflC (stomatin/prohibitin superfamily)